MPKMILFHQRGIVYRLSALMRGAAGTLPIPLDGMNQIILASGFLGLASGGIMVLSFTLVADLFPPSERGRYQGILAAVSTLPFTIGPSLGGWITDHWSWRWAFYVNPTVLRQVEGFFLRSQPI